jgi:hypothetical protein
MPESGQICKAAYLPVDNYCAAEAPRFTGVGAGVSVAVTVVGPGVAVEVVTLGLETVWVGCRKDAKKSPIIPMARMSTMMMANARFMALV